MSRRKGRDFYRKPKPPKKVPLRELAARAAADPYKDGKIRLFLDDDRACPDGWTPALSVKQLKDAIEGSPEGSIAEIALDWHLGSNVPDGHDAAAMLADMIESRMPQLSALETVYFHSSDVYEAGRMREVLFRLVMFDPDIPHIDLLQGHPMHKRRTP